MIDISRIEEEFAKWESQQYAGNSKEKRTKLAQFFTPAVFAKALIDKLGPLEDKDILDPCLGSGNLIAAAVLSGADPKRCYGIELDEAVLEVAKKRLAELGVPEENLVCGSALEQSSYAMKFDCIVMNPPYKRGLHIKILDEAIKHIKNTGIIISLQPIVKWQESLLFDSSLPVDNTCVLDRYTMDESSKLFNSHQRCDLGLVSIGKTSCTLVDNIDILQKIKTKLKQAISAAGLLVDKLEDDYKDFPVNFGYGVTIAGNGGHGKACYRLTGIDEAKATRREEIGHCARYNAKDKMEQHLIYSFYTNQLIRFIAKEFGFGGIPYKILPFATGFIDENGKTPLDEEWTFEKLAKWFELDYNDLAVVRKSLDTYLHPEEQKVIEETMEKYK